MFVVGVRFDSARMEMCWNSSSTSTPTRALPRPKPRSRAPKSMRDPLRKMIRHLEPCKAMDLATCGATRLCAASSFIDSYISSVVAVWCDVQMTRSLGFSRHRAKMMQPRR